MQNKKMVIKQITQFPEKILLKPYNEYLVDFFFNQIRDVQA